MIELFDDYVIIIDEYCYALCKRRKSKNTKTGKTQYTPIGYYSGVCEALKRLKDELVREKLKGDAIRLNEAVSVIKEANERVEALIESEIGKYER